MAEAWTPFRDVRTSISTGDGETVGGEAPWGLVVMWRPTPW